MTISTASKRGKAAARALGIGDKQVVLHTVFTATGYHAYIRPLRRTVAACPHEVVQLFTELTPEAIDGLLHAEIVARIAYVDRRALPCIVPIVYAYDGRALYGYSLLGAKIENMSANPNVCFEVDRIRNAADWCSVVVRGTFEQLQSTDADRAVELIRMRMSAVAVESDAPPSAAKTFVDRKGGVGVAYRILITDKHGRACIPIANE